MQRKRRLAEKESPSSIPEIILGYISVAGPRSLFDPRLRKLPATARPFRAKAADRKAVARELERIGFTIVAGSRLGFTVAGPAEAYEELTAGRVRTREKLVRRGPRRRYVTHVDIFGRKQPRELGVARARSRRLRIDGIALDQIRRHQAVSATPPDVDDFYLELPDDVADGTARWPRARERGAGRGCARGDAGFGHGAAPLLRSARLSVADGGCRYPWGSFGRGSRRPWHSGMCQHFCHCPRVRGAADSLQQRRGKDRRGVAGFGLAKASGARIITCSWSADLDIGLLTSARRPPNIGNAILGEILDALDDGILVIFAAGNGNFSLEPQVPGVLAAGGVFINQDGALRTSDIASAYRSPWFPGRTIPTVCGLAGMAPTNTSCCRCHPVRCSTLRIAVTLRTPTRPFDGTAPDDGWARFSGTSAAAPQLAGAAAVLLGAKPDLTASQITEALVETARDVTAGRCHPIFIATPKAGPGRDVATGAGLIDVGAALAYAEATFP